MILTGEQRIAIARDVLIEFTQKEKKAIVFNDLINAIGYFIKSDKNKIILNDIEIEEEI